LNVDGGVRLDTNKKNNTYGVSSNKVAQTKNIDILICSTLVKFFHSVQIMSI